MRGLPRRIQNNMMDHPNDKSNKEKYGGLA